MRSAGKKRLVKSCRLEPSLGFFSGTLNSGTPFPQASHIIPIHQGILMEMVWEQYGNGGPTIAGPWNFCWPFSASHSLKLTVRPWKEAIPKGNFRLATIHFQVLCEFQGGYTVYLCPELLVTNTTWASGPPPHRLAGLNGKARGWCQIQPCLNTPIQRLFELVVSQAWLQKSSDQICLGPRNVG